MADPIGKASDVILDVKGVSKAFGGVRAVHDVSFSVAPGTIKAIIGPNGAGKSTLLNLISGVLPVDTGSVAVDGVRIDGLPGHAVAAHGVARTFQLLRLFGNNRATVLDNVLLGAHLRLRPTIFGSLFMRATEERHQRDRAVELLRTFGLASVRHDTPQTLAFGQQRYVELARAMMLEPKILLLDEPASGLNDTEVLRLGETLVSLRNQGVTIVLIEHDMKLVMRIADDILVLAQGQRLAEGTPAMVRRDPEVIAAYLGPGSEAAHHA